MTSPEAVARDEFFESLLGDFLDESNQLLERLNGNLLQLDEWVRSLGDDHHQRCDDDLMNEMFRAAHSLKGLSAMLGLTDINQLTHKVENVFDAARKGELVIHGDCVELMFQAVDRLEGMVETLKDSGAEPVDSAGVLEGISQVLQSAGAERRRSNQADAEQALREVAVPAPDLPAPALPSGDAKPAEDRPSSPPASTRRAEADRIAVAPCGDEFAGLEDEPEISAKYLAIFIDETELALDSLAQTLMALEGGGTREAIEPLLMTSHRIKGSAASIGLNRAAKLAHLMEDLLQKLVDAGATLSVRVTDALLACTDGLRAHLEGLRQGRKEGDRFADLARELIGSSEAATDQPATAKPQLARPSPASPCTAGPEARPMLERAQAKAPASEAGNRPTETLRVDTDRLDQLMSLAGQLVISRARFTQIGEGMKAVLGTKRSLQTLDHVFGALDRAASPPTHGRAAENDPITELEAFRAQVRRIRIDMEPIRQDLESLGRVRRSVNELGEAIHQLDRVTDAIQQGVMDTRMVPIGPLFARFKRVVRDITRTNGRLIQLVINGEKTELDKRMIDELADPLIHMVRNAADHGIEPPEVRQSAGKPREGTITLDAYHRGNSIVIQVSDDGKGLDKDRILRKAIEKGMVTPADAEHMTPQQVYRLIWEPGLSTAEKVTEVSGRGMGMDIVKSKIEDLNGTADLESEPGQGTRLTIKLPLTLAILPSLMVRVGDDIFAIPVESVVEIVNVGRSELATVRGRWTARVRGRVIAVVRLDDLFTWQGAMSRTPLDERDETCLVVVSDRGRELGLVVDRVLGEEDVVIKSMAENFRNVPGIAGASILGDGRVSLIFDAPALIGMASRHASASAAS